MSKTKSTKAAASKPAKPANGKPTKDAKALTSVKEGRVTKPAENTKAKSKETAKKAAAAVEKSSKKSKKVKEPTPEEESDSSSSSSSESEVETKAVKTKGAKTNGAAVKKPAESDDSSSDSSSESDSEASSADDDESDSEETPVVKPTAQAVTNGKDESSDDSDDSSEAEDEAPAKTKAAPAVNGTKKAAKAASDDSDESSSDDSEADSDDSSEDSEEEAEAPSKKRKAEADVTPVTKKTKTDDAAASSNGGVKNLFVGNLSWNVDEEWLSREFEEFGELTGVRIVTDRESGRSRGFGYVEFATAESAQKAMAAKKGSELDGRPLNLDYAQGRDNNQNGTPKDRMKQRADKFGDQQGAPSATLFLGNLPFSATTEMVQEQFGEYGTITRISLPTDRETGSPKGYGYVEYGSVEEAQAAMQGLTGTEIDGRPVRLDFASARSNDGGSGGGRGGRGGFGGRGGRGGGGDRGRGGRGGRGGGRGGFGGRPATTNRGGFGDFQGKKVTF